MYEYALSICYAPRHGANYTEFRNTFCHVAQAAKTQAIFIK